jgi:hypothetical protein
MSVAQRPRLGRVAVAIAVVVLHLAVLVPTADAAPAPRYRPPVDAPISDPFRAPTSPYGPGNRGLEYDTAPGTVVRAAADGRVTFAGLVAGTRHVTVLHPDGLRTTVSRLATVAVVVGQQVDQGDVLGTTEGRLHFGARSGDSYLDPASLFGPALPHVRLVPFDLPPGTGIGSERSAISQLLGIGGAAMDLVGAGAALPGDAADWFGDQADDLRRTALEYLPQFVPLVGTVGNVVTAVGVLRAAWDEAHRPCTRADAPLAPPAERRQAVLVAGLGSTSGHAGIDAVDVGTLGYEPADVVRFSYTGGRTPGSSGHPPGVAAHRYSAADTQHDLRASAVLLADLVEQLAASAPGVPIDLVAHSQGGLVARLALIELQRRGATDAIGLLATIATPHQGADLATAARALGTTQVGDLALTAGGGPLGLDPSAPSIDQLAEGSDVVDELARTPLPEGVEAVSVAGRADVVVPSGSTRFDGARPVVIPNNNPLSHDDLPGDPRTTRELGLALVGAPPGCRSLVEAVLDQAVGAGISSVEDTAGAALWVGAGFVDHEVGLPVRAGTALVGEVARR